MNMSDEKQARDLLIYNGWAETYEDHKIQNVRNTIFDNLLNWLSGMRVNPTRVLDIGCGTGALLRKVGERVPGARLAGVDIAENMIKVANDKAPPGMDIEFRQAPAEELPFEDGEFDLVLSTVCFHHWRDQSKGLAEASRVLAPGGHLSIVDHFAIGWLRPLFAIGGSRDRIHTPDEIKHILKPVGLTAQNWQLMYSAGPLRIVHGVLAHKA